jgi:lipopolysaccharide export system protein LptA
VTIPLTKTPRFSRATLPQGLVLGLALVLGLSTQSAARAERGDRLKNIEIESTRGDSDHRNKVHTYLGNVTVRQGTLAILAERVEVRELPGGRIMATALGAAGRPATFRQKSDGKDEHVEGVADRIEYDHQNAVVRFVGNAAMRRLVGSTVADEISGALIAYDNQREFFSVEGRADAKVDGSASPGLPESPSGRVRSVFTPRPGSSNPAPAPAATNAPNPSPSGAPAPK